MYTTEWLVEKARQRGIRIPRHDDGRPCTFGLRWLLGEFDNV